MEEAKRPESIYSENIKTKGKTYFFDVKAAKNGNKYVSITESRIKDGQKFRSTLSVFPDHLQEFCEVLQKVATQVR